MAIDLDAMDELTRERLRETGFFVPGLGNYEMTTEVRKKPRRNKYNAQRTEYNGVRYDSKAEASQAKTLDAMVEMGALDWWLRQITIPLGPDFKTRVDFLVAKPIVCQNSNVATYIHAIEIKGVETREFRKVRELWPKYGPFDLKIVKKDTTEVIMGKH